MMKGKFWPKYLPVIQVKINKVDDNGDMRQGFIKIHKLNVSLIKKASIAFQVIFHSRFKRKKELYL